MNMLKNNKAAGTWLLLSLFCAVFALIYECFSFGVLSANMIFLYWWPFFLGAIPCILLQRSTSRLWNDGVLLLTAASLLAGIFEIYGTMSASVTWFRYAGITCLIIASGMSLARKSAAFPEKAL